MAVCNLLVQFSLLSQQRNSNQATQNATAIAPFGFCWCVWVGKATTVPEFNLSVTATHRLFPSVPLAGYSNIANPTRYDMYWTRNSGKQKPWRAKLLALLQTPFERTVFLDNDVYLLRRDFVTSMQNIARVSDVAMPIDPVRTAILVPMGCSCIVNYNINRVRSLFREALEIFDNRSMFKGMRRGDQEAIWLAWTRTTNHDTTTTSNTTSTRFLLLPEEYYCFWHGYRKVWSSAHRSYNCFALHGHGYTQKVLSLQDTRNQPPHLGSNHKA